MPALKPGQPAPEFSLQAHTGETITLSQFRGEKVVVLFFYPKDNTSVCTTEVCGFRDEYDSFVEAGSVVLGISSDGLASHVAFAKRHDVSYPLLVDEGGKVRKAYGVARILWMIPGRETFVIDREGTVRHAIRGMLNADEHVGTAMAAVRKLSR